MLVPRRGAGAVSGRQSGLSSIAKAGAGLAALASVAMGSGAKKSVPKIVRRAFKAANSGSASLNVGGKRKVISNPKARKRFKRAVKSAIKSRDVANIVKRMGLDGKLIYRTCVAAGQTITQNQTLAYYLTLNNASNIETALAELRFFNPAVPGTLTQGSGAAGVYQRTYTVKVAYTVICKNNSNVAAIVEGALCYPKVDTNIAPSTAWTNGLTNVGAPSSTSTLIRMRDSLELFDLWTLRNHKHRVLQPGQVMKWSGGTRYFEYDPALNDDHALTYQRDSQSATFFSLMKGSPCHDTVDNTKVAYSAGYLDFILKTEITVLYEAGCKLKFIVLSDGMDTVATERVSNRPQSAFATTAFT